MQQLELFPQDSEHYLFGQIQKLETSLDKRTRAIFSLLSELQDQIVKLSKDKNVDL